VKLFRKNSNLCDHNPPTLQTDRVRQTDRRHAIAIRPQHTRRTSWKLVGNRVANPVGN